MVIVPFSSGSSSNPLKQLSTALLFTVALGVSSVLLSSTALADSGTISYNSSFDFSFGSFGSGDGEFDRPQGITGDNQGRIYTTEFGGGRIQVFNADNGSFINRSSNGIINGHQITFDSGGNLIAADRSPDQIRSFDPSTLTEITGATYPVNTIGPSAYGLAVNPADGTIYSSDSSGNFIERFDSAGNSLGTIITGGSADGQVSRPQELAFHNGQLFVADAVNDRVQVFEPDGTFVDSFGTSGSGAGEFNFPMGIDVDNFGNIYVTDDLNNNVQVFSPDFTFLNELSDTFSFPFSAFADDSGRIYVPDWSLDEVQVFQFSSTEAFSSAPAGGDESATTPLAHLSLEGGGLDLSFSDDFLQYDTLTVDNSSGSWTLGGTSSFDDTVDVTNGRLTVNGSLTAENDFTVGATGRLGGTGTVGSTSGSVVIDGTLAPGNSVGTLNVSGDLTLGTGSTFLVELNPTAADRVNVTGSVTIDPGVTIDIDPTNVSNYAISRDYTILDASGGLTGTFDTIDDADNLAFLDLSLTYNPSDIVLTVTRNSYQFSDFAETQNESNTATGLTELINSGAPDSSVVSSAVTTLTGQQARSMLQQVTPNEGPSLQTTVQSVDIRARDLVAARLNTLRMGRRTGGVSAPTALNIQQRRYRAGGGADSPAPMPLMLSDASDSIGTNPLLSDKQIKFGLGKETNGYGTALGNSRSQLQPHAQSIWGMAIGSSGNVDSGVDVDGYNQQSIGFIGGADQDIRDNWTVGVNLGYIQSYVDFENSADSAQIDHYIAGLYGEYSIPDSAEYLGGGFIDLALNYQLARHDTSRKISVASLNRIAHATYDSHSLKGRISVGKDYVIPDHGFIVTPSLITSYGVSRQDKIEETNALSLNMTLNETYSHHWAVGGEVMVSSPKRYSADLFGTGYTISPALGVRVMQDLKDTTVPVTAAFSANPTDTFSVEGPDINRTTVTTQANVRLTPQDMALRPDMPTTLDLGLSHARASTHDNTTLSGKLTWQW